MLDFFALHYVALLVAAIVQMILGGIWYSSQGFGEKWAEVHRFDKSSMKPSALQYLGTFVNALVIAWVLGGLLVYFGVKSILGALCLAFWLWLGFVATSQFSGVIWARKPLGAYLIDAGFFLAAFLSIGLVYGLFFWWLG